MLFGGQNSHQDHFNIKLNDMIDNPNARNFYSSKEMIDRQNYITKLKSETIGHEFSYPKDLFITIDEYRNQIRGD